MNGFLCFDKPEGPSSYGIVHAVKKHFKERKAGHAGTLDPAASGVLVIALGNATRLLPYLPIEPKVYDFNIQFGAETDTLDATGTVIKKDGFNPTLGELTAITPSFTGTIVQKPPAFSAIKIDGERAYEKARRNETVEMKDRTITIFSLKTLSYDAGAGKALLQVTCSGGTYVRSLARDIAVALGTFGFAASIRRQAVGAFTIAASVPFSRLAELDATSLISMQTAFSGFPLIDGTPEILAALSFGRNVRLDPCPPGNRPALIFNRAGDLAALVEKINDQEYKPSRVFINSK